MNPKDFWSKVYLHTCCVVLFFIAAAAAFNGSYDKWRFLEIAQQTSTQQLSIAPTLDGTAFRPYVYRQLLPIIANWIDARVPEQTKDKLFATYVLEQNPPEKPFDSPVAQNRAYFLRYMIVYGMVFLSAWIAVYVMYRIGRSVGHPTPVAALSAIALILIIPYFQTHGGTFYDFPELCFMALAFWMALEVDWWWLIPVAVLGTANKEAFLFFVLTLYPIFRRRYSRTGALIGTGVNAFVCGLVYLLIRLRFQHNPGGMVEVHLVAQFQNALHLSRLFGREWTYGVVALQGFNPLSAALVVATAWRGWRFLPGPIQRHAMIAAAINFSLYIVLSQPGELRDLSMTYVSLLLLIAANLRTWPGDQPEMSPSLA